VSKEDKSTAARHQFIFTLRWNRTTTAVEWGSTTLTTLSTVFQRDKKRAPSVVVESPREEWDTPNPPGKANRLRSLGPPWDSFLHAPTQKQEAPAAASKGRGGPSAVGVVHIFAAICGNRKSESYATRSSGEDLCVP
jgi:hypothetical protein